jgi:hypothetical protein
MNFRMVIGSLAAVLLMASLVSAQIVVYSQPYVQPVPVGYGPLVVTGPVAPAFVPPPVSVVSAYRPVVPAYTPPPVAVVSSYRPVVPTYVAPATAYSTYRPAYAAPVAVVTAPPAPVYGTVTRYRTGVVGPGLGGLPSVYTPGQPVRNALRYVVP